MKIVAIENYPTKQRGGSEKAYFEVLIALKNVGHEIALAYCQKGDLVDDYEKEGIKTFNIESTNIQNWFSLSSYKKIKESLNHVIKQKPDILYINYLSDTPLAAILKVFYNIPAVCHIRVPFKGKSKQFSFSAKFINAFIVLNHKMKNEYEHKESLKNVYTVNDGILVPYETFNSVKKTKAIYLGRISPEKGIIELIKVWQILRDKYQINYPLDIVGPAYSTQEKIHADEITKLILEKQLDHIKILSSTINPIKTLSEYHFAVMPSTVEESFGRVLPEAILANTPIFARNIGITSEILHPQKELLIFDSEEELAQKISLLLDNKLHINMEILKAHILKNYNVENNCKQIEALLLQNLN